MTGTFSLYNHFATFLFDSGVDYSFISTNCLPLINMKPSVISLSYEIEIASSIKVETNKIIRGCKLELEGHTFIIDLIPFGYGSFDVIVGMDWLSKLRAKIVCYEKIVQIMLSNGDILEVHGERPKGNLKHLKTMKVNEPKLEDITVVREFPSVFLEDLSGVPPSRKVEFRIDLIPGAMPITNHLIVWNLRKCKNYPINLKSSKKMVSYDLVLHPGEHRIDDLFYQLQGAWYFSKIDPRSGYHRLRVREEDIPKTACRMRSYLNKFIIAFIDDILIFSKSKEEHEVHLKLILELLEKEKLFGKFSKCIKARILEAQSESSKGVNTPAEMLKGLDKQLERKEDGGLYLAERIWVPAYGNLRTLITNEAHATRYSVHPGAHNMYYDLRGLYWWHGMKKDISMYPEIPKWKWENIIMDSINKLPRTSSGHDSIWVIVDRLTKSAYFLAIREDYKTERLARLYINEIIARHDVPVSIISDHDSYFTSRFWQSLQKSLGTRLDLSTAYHPKTDGQKRLKAARDCQKSYADNRRKPLEFSVGDQVLLKMSPRKGVVHFGVHDMFHVSNLKKCLADINFDVPLEEIKIDDNLHIVEEPMKIMDQPLRSDVLALKANDVSLLWENWWVEAEMVSPEVESEEWRRLLLHWMRDVFGISTDGREEDLFPRNGM
ncbi:putative reverse transcriptase domain-containing protein [Tanacetum coccineum]|uniref:Reverse transcriptase domain-containing protein n=1 Tax=Tanacetum coccineum TaxID=301880 RepID=A0ABQ4XHZ2_9ASTR